MLGKGDLASLRTVLARSERAAYGAAESGWVCAGVQVGIGGGVAFQGWGTERAKAPPGNQRTRG